MNIYSNLVRMTADVVDQILHFCASWRELVKSDTFFLSSCAGLYGHIFAKFQALWRSETFPFSLVIETGSYVPPAGLLIAM